MRRHSALIKSNLNVDLSSNDNHAGISLESRLGIIEHEAAATAKSVDVGQVSPEAFLQIMQDQFAATQKAVTARNDFALKTIANHMRQLELENQKLRAQFGLGPDPHMALNSPSLKTKASANDLQGKTFQHEKRRSSLPCLPTNMPFIKNHLKFPDTSKRKVGSLHSDQKDSVDLTKQAPLPVFQSKTVHREKRRSSLPCLPTLPANHPFYQDHLKIADTGKGRTSSHCDGTPKSRTSSHCDGTPKSRTSSHCDGTSKGDSKKQERPSNSTPTADAAHDEPPADAKLNIPGHISGSSAESPAPEVEFEGSKGAKDSSSSASSESETEDSDSGASYCCEMVRPDVCGEEADKVGQLPCLHSVVPTEPAPRKMPVRFSELIVSEELPSSRHSTHSTHSDDELSKQFDLLDIWSKDASSFGKNNAKAVKNKALIKEATKMVIPTGRASAGEDIVGGPVFLRKFIFAPSSLIVVSCDIFSLFLVVYDLLTIPLMLLDPPREGFLVYMEWLTRLWWTTDIFLSFMTGYLLPDGTVVMAPNLIARKYVSRWFLLDLVLVVLDWIEICLGGGAGSNAQNAARMGKASRTFRILRMVRLLRLARMKEVLKFVRSRFRSEIITVLIDIIKVVGSILAVAHFVACGWYGVGKTEKHHSSWIYVGKYERESLWYRYILAFHWSISQFNGGMELIGPVGQRERVYAVFVGFMCWVMAAAFVSALTSEMTRLHILASQKDRQTNILQRYLKQCRITDKLALRVQRNAQHAITEQQRLMPESQIELLSVVSEPLRVELHFEMYSPVLEVHPFFQEYVNDCPQVVRKVCHEAMTALLIASGDVIFNAGEIPNSPKMYVVCTGNLDYIPLAGQVIDVVAEHWLSEAVLWTVWMHRGVLKATGEGRLCVLDASRFQYIAGRFDHHSDLEPRNYGAAFVGHLNRLIEDGELDAISDMPSGNEGTLAKRAMDGRSSIGSAYGGKSISHIKRRRSAFMDPTTAQKLMSRA